MSNKLVFILKLSVFLLLLGRGVLHFTANQPYEAFFYVEDLKTVSSLLGSILLFFSFLVWIPERFFYKYHLPYLFLLPSLILFFHSYGLYIQSGYVIEQMIEHGIQILIPLVFIFIKIKSPKLNLFLIIITVLTFLGHGMFAVGVNYIPKGFQAMVFHSFQFELDGINLFLLIFGVLDFISILLIWFSSTRKIALFYMIIWGFITALARLYAYIGIVSIEVLFQQNLFEFLLRIPHSLVPLVIFLQLVYQKKTKLVPKLA